MKHNVCKSGVYVRRNVSSTKMLQTDRKICSKHTFRRRFETFVCTKNNKRGVLIRARGLENCQNLISGEDGN